MVKLMADVMFFTLDITIMAALSWQDCLPILLENYATTVKNKLQRSAYTTYNHAVIIDIELVENI